MMRGEPVVKTPGRTYLLHCTVTGLVKIGIAVDVEQRFRTIQAMCPTRLEVIIDAPGGRELERALHEKYAHKRKHGEWFDLTHDELQEIVWNLPEDEPEPEAEHPPAPDEIMYPEQGV